MRRNIWLWGSLIGISALLPGKILADTYHPGFWQPKARVSPGKLVEVDIVNKSNLVLQYGFSQASSIYSLGVGKTVKTFKVSLPTSMLINPATNDLAALKFTVKANKNLVVVVVTRESNGSPGDHAVNVNATGGVYIY